MLKILEARLQQYVNWEFSDVQAGFRKGRGTEIKLPTSIGSQKKQENSRKTSTSASWTMLKPLTLWITTNCGKFLKRWGKFLKSWAPKNWCFWTVVLEKTLEGPLDSKEIDPVNPKENQPWIFIGRTGDESEAPATWCKEPTHWKRLSYWEKLRARGEGDDRGWNGWMSSLTQWTWVWASSRSWWRTGKPGVLQSMGSQSQT